MDLELSFDFQCSQLYFPKFNFYSILIPSKFDNFSLNQLTSNEKTWNILFTLCSWKHWIFWGREESDRRDWVGNKTLQKSFIFNFHGAVLLQLSELNEASNQKTLWPFQLFAQIYHELVRTFANTWFDRKKLVIFLTPYNSNGMTMRFGHLYKKNQKCLLLATLDWRFFGLNGILSFTARRQVTAVSRSNAQCALTVFKTQFWSQLWFNFLSGQKSSYCVISCHNKC